MSRIEQDFNQVELAYGYDAPVQNQNPAIKNFLDQLAGAGALKPKAGYFFSVYLKPLRYEQENSEELNDKLDLIDPSGEGTIINAGFMTGLTPEEFKLATSAWHLPLNHRKMVLDGLDPKTGQQVAQPVEIMEAELVSSVPTPMQAFIAAALYVHFAQNPEAGVLEQIEAFLNADRDEREKELKAKLEPRTPGLFYILRDRRRINYIGRIKSFFFLEFGGDLDEAVQEAIDKGLSWYSDYVREVNRRAVKEAGKNMEELAIAAKKAGLVFPQVVELEELEKRKDTDDA